MLLNILVIGGGGKILDEFRSAAAPRVGETIILADKNGGSQVVRRVTWTVPVTEDEYPGVLLTVGPVEPAPPATPAAPVVPADPGLRPPPPPRPIEPDPDSAPGRSTVHSETMLADARYDWKEAHEHCPDPTNCDCVCPRCMERWENAGRPGTAKENE